MTTKITFLFALPTDVEVFERSFAANHLELLRALPGVERIESARVWPKEDGSQRPAHRIVDAYFPDYPAATRAVTTAEAGRLFAALGTLASGGVTILFSDIEAD